MPRQSRQRPPHFPNPLHTFILLAAYLMLTVVAPAHLLIHAERLGVNDTTLKYFAVVVSGSIDGDGHVSAAMKAMCLASGKRAVAITGGRLRGIRHQG
ncbi:hypothetical protein PYWP30_01537 [Pyrobaculum sp. WP30]|nr:hypothetical protein PYWP30_01537 [Pyrobaculum sp. WP30]